MSSATISNCAGSPNHSSPTDSPLVPDAAQRTVGMSSVDGLPAALLVIVVDELSRSLGTRCIERGGGEK